MPRGGVRPNAGRPRGARAIGTTELLRWLDKLAPREPMNAALAIVAEHPDAPVAVRLEALRRLFAVFAVKAMRLHPVPTRTEPGELRP